MTKPTSALNYSFDTVPTNGTLNISAPLGFLPTSGNLLVAFIFAAANQTSSNGWVEHKAVISDGEMSIFTKTSDGTETQLELTQNGGRHLAYAIFEFPAGTTISEGVGSLSATPSLLPVEALPAGNNLVIWSSGRVTGSESAISSHEWAGATEVCDLLIPATGGNEGVSLTLGFEESTASSFDAVVTPSGSFMGQNYHSLALAVFVPDEVIITPPPVIPFGSSIAAENAYDGRPASEWLDGVGSEAMPAFGRSTYFAPGSDATFSIDYNLPFTLDIFRLGHYAGNGARLLVQGLEGTPAAQPAPVAIPGGNGAVTCEAWSINASWSVPADATPGWYYALLRGTNDLDLGYVLFAVSDAAAKKPTLIITGDATWHAAYNGYGGNNVYGAAKAIGSTADRAFCSTYDKPVITRDYVPQTHFLNNTYPYLKWSESMGYNAGVATIEQIKNDPTILDGRQLLVWTGHNEYIPQNVMDKTQALLLAGQRMVNVAGNDFFWRVRFTSGAFTAGNGRVMWCKKDTMSGPSTGPDATPGHVGGNPFTTEADWTGTWQDTRWSLRKPSEDFFGDRFIANGVRSDRVEVPATMKSLPAWRNCPGIQALGVGGVYQFQPGTLGMEWDMPILGNANVEQMVFSSTEVDLIGNASDINGESYGITMEDTIHSFTMVKKGLGVVANFNSDQWGWALDALHLRGSAAADVNAQQMMLNVLSDLGSQPHSSSVLARGLAVPSPVSLSLYGFIEEEEPPPPPPPPPSSTTDIEVLMARRQIDEMIRRDAEYISFRRKTRIRTADNGWIEGPEETLAPQQVSLIPFKRRMTEIMVNTEFGDVPDLPYVLLGRHNLNIQQYDTFTLRGEEFRVESIDIGEPDVKTAAHIDYFGGQTNG